MSIDCSCFSHSFPEVQASLSCWSSAYNRAHFFLGYSAHLIEDGLLSIAIALNRVFSALFCLTPPAELTAHTVFTSSNQNTVLRRKIFYVPEPGIYSCTYMASQACFEYLKGRLNNEVDLERTLLLGMGSLLEKIHFRLRPGFFSETSNRVIERYLASLIDRQDRTNPQPLSDVISYHNRVYPNWDEIKGAFTGRLVEWDYSDFDNANGLYQDRVTPGTEKTSYRRAIEALMNCTPEGRGAAIFTINNGTYMVGFSRNRSGTLAEITFADSHGHPFLFNKRGAYFKKWTQDNSPDIIESAAQFMSQIVSFRTLCEKAQAAPARVRGGYGFSFLPLRLDQ